MKKNKQSIQSSACCYDVEYHYDTEADGRSLWKVRRSNIDILEEARNYIKDLQTLTPEETYRIVKREITCRHSVVETYSRIAT